MGSGTPLQSITRTTSAGRLATRYALKATREWHEYSKLETLEEQVPQFAKHEVLMDDVLGKGGFCYVYALAGIKLDDEHYDDSNADDGKEEKKDMELVEKDDRDVLLRRHSNRKSRKWLAQQDARKFAVKTLKPNLSRGTKELFCNGAADLVMEAHLLSSIPYHNNLIHCYGVSSEGPSVFASDCQGFFIILDRLNSIRLSDRYRIWKYHESGGGSAQLTTTLVERLEVARDVSSALAHLHRYGVIYRDLKAENIGFDMTESRTLKLFDFGLAKELNPNERVYDNSPYVTYNMTGHTGSTRYMSPEVACSQPYGLAADVYSFAILLYELLSLTRAFGDIDSSQEFHRRVIMEKERPPIDYNSWSNFLIQLLRQGWAHEPQLRPTMQRMHEAIQTVLDTMLMSASKTTTATMDMEEDMASPTTVIMPSSSACTQAAATAITDDRPTPDLQRRLSV